MPTSEAGTSTKETKTASTHIVVEDSISKDLNASGNDLIDSCIHMRRKLDTDQTTVGQDFEKGSNLKPSEVTEQLIEKISSIYIRKEEIPAV